MVAGGAVGGGDHLVLRRRASPGYLYPECPEEHRTDLTVYTEAGGAFFDGGQPYEVANPRGWTYLYPPMLALLLAPLDVLPTQDQVTVWFFVSLLFCWGCCRECRRIVTIVCDEDPSVAAAWARWSPWLAVAAVAAALHSHAQLFATRPGGHSQAVLSAAGAAVDRRRPHVPRLAGRRRRPGLADRAEDTPAGAGRFSVVPATGGLGCEPLEAAGFSFERNVAVSECPTIAMGGGARRRFAASTLGVALGLALFFLFVPAMLVGWRANLHHLDTWGRFMLTKADDGGMDPRSGNSHTAAQSESAQRRLSAGQFRRACFRRRPRRSAGRRMGVRRRWRWTPPPLRGFCCSRQAMLTLALLALGVRLSRGDGNRLNLAVGFALACVAMLVVSPVARGHYFLLLAPAVLLVPLWLDRCGRRRAGVVMAAIPAVLSILHYVLLPYAGRIGLLGLGTAAWLMAAMVLMARADQSARRVAGLDDASPTTPTLSSIKPRPVVALPRDHRSRLNGRDHRSRLFAGGKIAALVSILRVIGDNPIMKSGWPMLAIPALLLGGCTREPSPPPRFPNAVESGLVDDFGLPLVIVIDLPKVPKEIEGPSPPIKEEPASAGGMGK